MISPSRKANQETDTDMEVDTEMTDFPLFGLDEVEYVEVNDGAEIEEIRTFDHDMEF